MDHQQSIRPLRYIRKNFEWRPYVEQHYDIKYAGEHELRVNCPNCDDRKHKLYINEEKKVFHCFKCDFTTRKGAFDVFDFVAITEGLTKKQAIAKLITEYKPVTPEDLDAAISGMLDAVPESTRKFKHPYLTAMPSVAIKLTEDSSDTEPFWSYLRGRGLTTSEIVNVLQTYVVMDHSHVIVDHKGHRKGDIGRRILWPIYGGDNKLISWQARCFETADAVKYLNAPDTAIAATLWPYVPPHPSSTIVLCEGLLDAVALRRLPKTYSAYATFSKHISQEQINLLTSWGVKSVILFWDLDAKREVRSTVKKLQLHFELLVPYFADWPTKFDCGACLSDPLGLQYMQRAVDRAIAVRSLEYLRWELES
jgi:DNA primase